MTFIGAIVALALVVTKHKPKRFGWDIYFNVGKNWGGVEFGPFFLTDDDDYYPTKCHEHGHGFQNIVIGPLFPFLVGIPSSIRYWLREMKTFKAKTIYSCVLSFVLVSISIVGIVVGSMFCTPIEWVGLGLFFYFVMLSAWLFDELQKYKNDNYPKYDDFFPEGHASRCGKEFIEKE